jgi:hypothetical protein
MGRRCDEKFVIATKTDHKHMGTLGKMDFSGAATKSRA